MTRADDPALAAALSAVMDGRATADDWRLVNTAWQADPALRERWALWHVAADGLRSAELPAVHRDPQALLDALHAQLPAPVVPLPRRREWLAPLGVAAGFVAMAVGLGTLRPPATPEALVAAAPNTTPRVQGLVGTSFAQAAEGRTLTTWAVDPATPVAFDWAVALPEPAASRPGP